MKFNIFFSLILLSQSVVANPDTTADISSINKIIDEKPKTVFYEDNEVLKFNFPKSQVFEYNFSINSIPTKNGKIEWAFDGKKYKVKFFTSVFFYGDILFESNGIVNKNGLAPLEYKTIRGKKQSFSTFDYANNTLTFSKSSTKTKIPSNVKDFASTAFQIIGLVRAKQPKLKDIYKFNVANESEIQLWNIKLVDIEQDVYHFVRLPRNTRDKRKIEWWLDASNGWSIKKFKQTEPSGVRLQFDKK